MPLLGLSFVGLRLFRPVGSIRLRGRAIACGNTPGFLGLWLFRPVGSIRLRGRAIACGNTPGYRAMRSTAGLRQPLSAYARLFLSCFAIRRNAFLDVIVGIIEDVFQDGEDVGERTSNAASRHFVDHVECVVREAPRIDLRRMPDVSEFFHGHRKRAQVAQNARFDEWCKVRKCEADDFGTFANVAEWMGFDLLGAGEFDFATFERFGVIFFAQRFIDVEIDVDIGGSRAPEPEDEEIARQIARTQIGDVFGIDEVAQSECEKDGQFFGDFGERTHMAGVFELCHLREVERIEQSFVGFWRGATARLDEEDGARNALIEREIGADGDAALFVVFGNAFVDGIEQILALWNGEFGANALDDVVCGKMGSEVEVTSRCRFFSEEFLIDSFLNRLFHEIDLLLGACFVLRFEVEIWVIVVDIECSASDGLELRIAQAFEWFGGGVFELAF